MNKRARTVVVLLNGLLLAPTNVVADDVVFSSNVTATSPTEIYQASTHNADRTLTINENSTLTSAGLPTWGVSVLYLDADLSSVINRGTVTGDYYPISITSGATITSFINYGTIISTNSASPITNSAGSIITTLTNFGTIASNIPNNFDIYNGTEAYIATLNNLQGAGNPNGPLVMRKNSLNYNVIINSPTQYGQLWIDNLGYTTNPTNFGIYSGSTIRKGTYAAVLSNFTSVDVNNTSGNFNGFTWSLINSSGNIWDLVVTGASTIDTQSSLHSLASKLRGAFSSQVVATNYANMNTYDCHLFDERGLCISVGGQQTYVDSPSSNLTSTVVVAGYKVSPTLRIGGFLNQNLNNSTSRSVDISNANPLMGLFAVWNQNEDHLGYQVKVANAYQDKDVKTIREVTGTSEAGRGNTELNTQSYVGELSYAFLVNDDKTLVRPYTALRYTRIKQDAYTEEASSGVTAPLTYSALSDRSTSALVGVKVDHKLAEKVNLKASLGIEQDLYHHVDNLTATGVSGLTSENFNDNIKRTRPVASIGAYYMPAKNQRISADLYYQQLPFQSTGSATAYVNYMVGF